MTSQALQSVQQAMSMAMALMTSIGILPLPTVKDMLAEAMLCLVIRRIQCQLQPQHSNGSNGFQINGIDAGDYSGNSVSSRRCQWRWL